jgi:hypothetical protein
MDQLQVESIVSHERLDLRHDPGNNVDPGDRCDRQLQQGAAIDSLFNPETPHAEISA